MDKEIKECDFYNTDNANCVMEEYLPHGEKGDISCKSYINCYYKQLTQANAKIEELEEKYKWYNHYKDSALSHTDRINNEFLPKIDTLTQENKELKQYKGSKQASYASRVEQSNLGK